MREIVIRALVFVFLGTVFGASFVGTVDAESIVLTEEAAFNTSGGPFDSGLVVAETSNSSPIPGTITIDQYEYANLTSGSIVQYIDGSYANEGFNGIIIYSDQSDPIFTSVTLTSQNAYYGNPFYPGPFTAADVTFNDHEIALNFSDISVIGTFSLSFTTASVVPEPSSIVLTILGGLGGLLASRAREWFRIPAK